MKKLLCFTLSLLMLLALHIPVAATETGDPMTSSSNLNDSLVSWWNFEGDKVLTDKATNGTSKDALVLGGNAEVSDGVAYVPSAKGSYIELPSTNKDLNNISSVTLYMKVKYEGDATAFVDLFHWVNLCRLYKTTGTAFNVIPLNKSSYKASIDASKIDGFASAEWIYVAVTMDIPNFNTEDTAITSWTCTASLYISVDGVEYTSATNSVDITVSDLQTVKTNMEEKLMLLGKNGTGTDDRGVSFYYDDVRIYNKALTADEIASINLPTCVGYQVKDDTATEGNYSLRFLATVNSLDFAEVGFEITAAYGSESKPFTESCKYVYQSVNAANGSVTAESKGGNYLIALAVTGIPDDVGEVTYTVKPFAKTSTDATPTYGESVTVVHNIAS